MVRTTFLWRRMGYSLVTVGMMYLFMNAAMKNGDIKQILIFSAAVIIALLWIARSMIIVDMSKGTVTIPFFLGKTVLNVADIEASKIDHSTELTYDRNTKQYNSNKTRKLVLFGKFGTKTINCGGGNAAYQAQNNIEQAIKALR